MNTRGVVLAIAVTIVVLLAAAFGLAWFLPERIGITHVDSHPLPAPGVVVHEGEDRILLEKKQREVLQGGGNRMSIDDAMTAVVARGPHAFDPPGDQQ